MLSQKIKPNLTWNSRQVKSNTKGQIHKELIVAAVVP